MSDYILQANPKANYLAHKDEIDAAIRRVLDSGWYVLGQEVAKLEKEFADYIEVNYAVGVASGTDALVLSLRACGIGYGDLVLTVSHTAVATIAAIKLVGAVPVLIDIDPVYYTLDPNCLETVLKKSLPSLPGIPKAVIPVHLYGHPADMEAIVKLAEKYGLFVIEDCAQAHGASLQDHRVGSWGDVAAFSFYPTKNLGALGDGGIVVTNNRDIFDKVFLLRQYGWKDKFVSCVSGYNSRLDELQAAILRVKLKYLDEENSLRRKLATIYDHSLSDMPLKLPSVRRGSNHVYHQYVVFTELRDELRSFLGDQGVNTAIHYPVPIHLQPAYKRNVVIPYQLFNTERTCKGILSLPMYPQLRNGQVIRVSKLIKQWFMQYVRGR